MKKPAAKRSFRRHLLLAMSIIVLIGGSLIWYFCFENNPEAQIKNHMQELVKDISKSEKENPALNLLKLKTAADAFAYPLEINFDGTSLNFESPEQFTSALGRYRAMLKSLELELSHIDVFVDSPTQARAEASVHGSIKTKLNEAAYNEAYDISAELTMLDDQWKIKKLKAVRAIHRGK